MGLMSNCCFEHLKNFDMDLSLGLVVSFIAITVLVILIHPVAGEGGCYDLFVMLSARANMLLCHVVTKLCENGDYTRCQDGY